MPERKLTPEQRFCLVEDYRKMFPIKELMGKYGLCRFSIYQNLRFAQEPPREKFARRFRTLNEQAFACPESNEEAAYWVGFLMADGNIHVRRQSYSITVALTASDDGHLEKFRKFLGSDHPFQYKPGHRINKYLAKPSVYYRFNSYAIGTRLVGLGVATDKKNRVSAGSLSMNRHFWRGLVDGDGSLGLYHRKGQNELLPEIDACGSKPLMEEFLAYCKTICPDTKRKVRQGSGIWRISFSSQMGRLITNELYRECKVALDRKDAIARQIVTTLVA